MKKKTEAELNKDKNENNHEIHYDFNDEKEFGGDLEYEDEDTPPELSTGIKHHKEDFEYYFTNDKKEEQCKLVGTVGKNLIKSLT